MSIKCPQCDGPHTLSQCPNWRMPAKLTPAMHDAVFPKWTLCPDAMYIDLLAAMGRQPELRPSAPSADSAADARDAWQPIETAPKDGTCILLGCAEDEENDRGEISTPGRWHDEDHDGPDNMGHDAGFMDDEFQQFAWGRSFGADSYKSAGFQPTHWQPLPAAPIASTHTTTGGENA